MASADRTLRYDCDAHGVPRLLVDDDGFLRSVEALCDPAKWCVESATAVGPALRLCTTREYALLLLDLRLPDGSGIDVLREVRRNGSRAAAMLVTGYGDVGSTVEAMRLGACDVLEKPIPADSLIFAIEKVLCAGEASDELKLPALPTTAEEELSTLMKACIALSSTVGVHYALDALVAHLLRPFASGFSRNMLVFVAVTDALRFVIEHGAPGDSTAETLTTINERALRRLSDLSDDPHGMGGSFLRRMAASEAGCLEKAEEHWGRALGMHPSHFGRQLQRLTGLSFADWRRSFRLKRALQLLHRTDEQCAQIAFASGYSHASQFNHEFRRFFGMAPQACRARLRRRAARPASIRK